ncbi:MAG TPA: IS91 family transposase [Verrucomicrobiales bacterium]|nr:IS91 family transposase [Verrucomicrobiales bacterium]
MPAPHGGAPGFSLSVAEVVRRFLPGLPLAPHPQRVLRRLERCHTGQHGWSLWQCEACAAAHWRPLGCGDRHCPECTGRAREAWLQRQHEALLPVRYYHWVFTLPAVLRPLALQNPEEIYTLLFDAASATLLEFGQERFGVRLGITALLHTWGQNLMDHPHLHCLVTGGGLTAENPPQWRGPKQAQYLFPVQAVAKMFAGKFLAGLAALRPELPLEGSLRAWRDPAVWQRTMAALHGTKWIVFAKGSVVGPESVLQYLGRYTHRVAISNGRLLRMDERTVTFRYKDYRKGEVIREMTLAGTEFVRRLSLHILPPGFTKIRHYGILGNNRRAQDIPRARAALEHSPWRQELSPSPPTPPPPPAPATCPRCGGEDLICVGRLESNGRFLPLQRGARRLRLSAGEPPVCDSS